MPISLWADDTGILIDNAGVLVCEKCPCDTGSGGSVPGEPCIHCNLGTTPRIYRAVFSSVTNSGCGDCASTFNAEFELVQDDTDPCLFVVQFTSPCWPGKTVVIELLLGDLGGASVTVYVAGEPDGGTWLVQPFRATPFDCSEPMSFVNFNSVGTKCNFHGSTVMVTAA